MARLRQRGEHRIAVVEPQIPLAPRPDHLPARRAQLRRDHLRGIAHAEDEQLHGWGAGVFGSGSGGGTTSTAFGTWSFFHCIAIVTRVLPEG